jgi:formylglycine-generating enzyme
MSQKVLFRSLAAAALAALLAATTHAESITHGTTTINMDFVRVGDPGNAGDLQSQGTFGSVGYVYHIGKYEVSENQWDAVNAANVNDPLNDPRYWSGEQPAAAFSWHEAAMFCNWLTSGDVTQGYYSISGGVATPNALDHDAYAAIHGTTYFIPTESEWYKAAYYDPNKSGAGVAGYWDYPTKHDGPNVPDGIDYNGDTAFDAVFWDGYDQHHPNAVDNAGVLSGYGTMGQGGNIYEWTETARGSSRVLRGGYWYADSSLLAASYHYDNSPSVEGNLSVGFRVASVPEPGSITLLLCGAIAAMKWFRRRM